MNNPSSQNSFSSLPLKVRIFIIANIILYVLGVLFVFFVIFTALSTPDNAKNSANSNYFQQALTAKPGETNGPYYERQGYERKKLGPTIADGFAIDFTRTEDATALTDGTKIIQACSLLTLDEIQKAGLKLDAVAQSETSLFQQSYVDGHGQGGIKYDDLYGDFGEANKCTYTPESIFNRIEIHVVQAFQQDDILLPLTMENKPKVQSLKGFENIEFYDASDDKMEETGYILHVNDTYIKFSLHLTTANKNERQQKANKLAAAIAANFLRVSEKPTSQPIATYRNSPTFKTTYLRACTVLNEEGIQALGYAHAGAYATETISTATGVSTFSVLKDKTPYVYAQNKCTRSALQADKKVAGRASILTTTYTSSQGAKQHLKTLRVSAKDKQEVTGVGDEAVVSTDTKAAGHYTIRKDRAVIDITYEPEASLEAPEPAPTTAREFKTFTQAMAEQVIKLTPKM